MGHEEGTIRGHRRTPPRPGREQEAETDSSYCGKLRHSYGGKARGSHCEGDVCGGSFCCGPEICDEGPRGKTREGPVVGFDPKGRPQHRGWPNRRVRKRPGRLVCQVPDGGGPWRTAGRKEYGIKLSHAHTHTIHTCIHISFGSSLLATYPPWF